MSEHSRPYELRPETPDDEPFLRRLFAATHDDLLAIPLPATQLDGLIDMQFRAQRAHYRAEFPLAKFQIVIHDGAPIGNVSVATTEGEIRLIDLGLLPDYRGKGIGSALIGDLIDESRKTGLPLNLHVAATNRARRLYLRLGFREIGEQGPYIIMSCKISE